MKKWLIAMFLIFTECAFSEVMHRKLTDDDNKTLSFTWEEASLKPFDELIVSWNATRPKEGAFLIQVSLLVEHWSPWIDYAYWGINDQYSFENHSLEYPIKGYQDIVEVTGGCKARGFKIRVIALNGANLKDFRHLHSAVVNLSQLSLDAGYEDRRSIELSVPGLSQMALQDERAHRLCSPTSLTAVIRFLDPSCVLSPLDFADQVRDSRFDIYGNWVLNVAEAANRLSKWTVIAARLESFSQILDELAKGNPVIVSIKGPLPGSASPYSSGHLIVVRGYDPIHRKVLCMDPAFPSNELTHVSYALQDFITAWNRRQGIAYLFQSNYTQVNTKLSREGMLD